MTNTAATGPLAKHSLQSRFWAVVRYELLWNLRKKKILVVLIAATALELITFSLTPLASELLGQSIPKNPDYVVSTGISGLILFFFALVVAMNSISGEFESGTAVTLLTKPVSRTTIFLGKLVAALLTLISPFVLLFVIEVIGGMVVYGPQNHLYLLPLTFLGAIVSTLVWLAIVLALSSVTKSSVLTAVISVVVYIAVSIAVSTIALFTNQSWFLTSLPGGGGTGYLIPTSTVVPNPSVLSASVSTGTDGIASNLVNFVLHPSYYVEFVKENLSTVTSSATAPTFTVTSVEPLSYVVLTSLCVAFAYIFVFLFIAWFSLKRAEISE